VAKAESAAAKVEPAAPKTVVGAPRTLAAAPRAMTRSPAPVMAAPEPVATPPAPKVRTASAQPPLAGVPSVAHAAALSGDNQRQAHEAYARGNARLLEGRVDEAIVAFKESLKLDPRDPSAQRGLGLAYLQAGNANQAAHYLRRYLRAAPGAADRQLIEKRLDQLANR
jgi:tetratricopeptide (TPR) repeat protein